MPFISFIVTYHNEPPALLRPCVESILRVPLTPEEREVIVVDDGSRESAEAWLREVHPDLIYERQEQAGLSVARNRGMACSRGRYLQFVDADDCLLPRAYSRVVKLLRNGAPDAVLFHLTTQHKDSDRQPKASMTSGPDFLRRHNLRAAAVGYAFSRKALGELRFHPGIFHEDELFTPQAFLRFRKLCATDIAPYFYRQHSGTITRTASVEHLQKRRQDIRFALKELSNLHEPMLDRRIHQLVTDILWGECSRTSSLSGLKECLQWCRREGFLPLPLRLYSVRYLLTALAARLCP